MSCTMLGCLNWPMMAASCRNLIVSSPVGFGCNILTATSLLPLEACQIPLFTVPNCPDPKYSVILSTSYFTLRTLYYIETTHCIWCLQISLNFLLDNCWYRLSVVEPGCQKDGHSSKNWRDMVEAGETEVDLNWVY